MKRLVLFVMIFRCVAAREVEAQGANGALEFTARVTPTAAKPEPVRDFTFYVLTKSYDDIVKDIDERDGPPAREKFIDELKISPELRTWLHKHDVMDMTLPGFDKLLTPDDVLHVPEFLLAYQRSNSGGVTNGIPVPKYREADKTENPTRYEKQHQEYLNSLKKFITSRPETMAGMELELDGVNPARKWAEVQNTHRRRVLQLAPAEAQTKYLAAKADTDLDGRATVPGLAPGNYWVSTLALTAVAGDARLRWDVPVRIAPGQTLRIELTNLNATDNLSSR
ncbi:MAG TPA: carboxypeptidase-like regulatory domain-containing protein [Candidatus Acidoferrum sp.]|nr:carboxypeptidase-like regulatory domain-containing protein [Candidatus Acidoferrum sp.]